MSCRLALSRVSTAQMGGRERVPRWRIMRARASQVLNLSEVSLSPDAKGCDDCSPGFKWLDALAVSSLRLSESFPADFAYQAQHSLCFPPQSPPPLGRICMPRDHEHPSRGGCVSCRATACRALVCRPDGRSVCKLSARALMVEVSQGSSVSKCCC